MDLYFIALIPNQALRNEIKALKVEIYKNTGAKKALNSPAHITIQRPFRREAAFEKKLISKLASFAKKHNSFNITLSGFNCFEPRTIFVDVLDSNVLNKLQSNLNEFLLDSLVFKEKELSKNSTPHITIANRDLIKNDFYRVWPTYKNREFHSTFIVESIFLLKYNGKNWDIIQEFLFKK